MRRMLRGSMALLMGIVVLVLGRAAGAQEDLPLFQGITVTPGVLSSPGPVTVTVPGLPGEVGCRFGSVLAGSSLSEFRVLVQGNFDVPDTFRPTQFENGSPFATGEYKIFVRCTDEKGNETTYRTDQTLTILDTATTTTTTTTTTVPPGTSAPRSPQGSVEPSSAKPGETTITIRGGGFKVGAALQITLATTPVTELGTTSAPDGFYGATLKLPVQSPPGTHQLVVTGPGPDDAVRSTTATLTVQDLDCADFASPEAAQAALVGGRDPHGLDGNNDGIACNGVSARTAAGSGGGAPAESSGSLPQTGSQRTEVGIMVGLTAMTLGALFLGLSHPAEPVGGHHRRRRGR